ncbi:DUF2188 domain-containing protein [soil metagenome]
MSDRKVFHSVHKGDAWCVVSGGKTVSKHKTQQESEDAAISAGRAVHDKGGLGQAVLHLESGTIKTEHTYGKDPRSTPG